MYEWNWQIIWFYRKVFLSGALVTLALTITAVVSGTALGALIAFIRRSRIRILSILARLYIESLRALPILVLLIWIFYVIPILTHWPSSAFVSAVIALTINLSAFVAETIRAGIESIPHTQYESGLALGMSSHQVMKKIVLPQALRSMLPNLTGLYITQLKNSSLASIIAVNELLHRSNILISETFRPLEIYTAIAVVYLAIILPLIYISKILERHFGAPQKIVL